MTSPLFKRRRKRTRFKLTSHAYGRPRLSVFRSGKHIYAQIIDDRAKETLAAASTNEKEGKLAKTY
ncbi:50S ribosomal protein L18, partial [Xanthomonas citri pv. citri]|nr:50S ribosomal protein L18 [Xanthomonas citri pv. citri]